jgi:hypothetical protein
MASPPMTAASEMVTSMTLRGELRGGCMGAIAPKGTL